MLQKYLHVINSVCVEHCHTRAGRIFESQLHMSLKRIAIYNILQIMGWQ